MATRALLDIRADERPRLGLNGSYLAGGRLLGAMLGLGRGALLARYLTPEGFGVLGVVNLILAYGALSNLGLKPAAHRDMLQAQGRGDRTLRGEIQDTAVSVTTLLAVVAGAVIAGYGLIATAGAVRTAVVVGALLVVLANVYGWLESGAWLGQRFSAVASLQLLTALVSFVTAVGGAMFWGIEGVLGGLLATQIGMIAVAAWSGWPDYRVRLDVAVLRRLVRTGLPMFLGVLALVALRNIDYVLVIGLLGRQEWGHYALALLAVSFLSNAATDYARVAYPAMQERYGASQSVRAVEPHVDGALHLIAVAAAVVAGALIVTVHAPIAYWLPDYGPAILLIHILTLGFVFQAIAWPADLCLTTIGKQYVCFWLRFIAVVANVALAFALLRFGYGALGAATASAAAWALYSLSVLVIAGRTLYGAGALRLVRRAVSPFLYVAAGLVMLTAAGGYRSSDVTVVALSAAAYAVYVAPLFIRREAGAFRWAFAVPGRSPNA